MHILVENECDSSSFVTVATDICFEVQHSIVAIHTRRSAGCSDSDDTSGFFRPQTNDNDPSIEKCPFWLLLARVIGSKKIELIAIPGCTGFKLPEFFLRIELILPGGCDVTSIAFYGDDGHSSLTPNLTKNAEVKEGRQAVGFVVECTSSSAHEVREELWVTPYDDLIFKKYDFNMNSKNGAFVRGTNPNEACAVPMSVDDVVRDDNAVFPKREFLVTALEFNVCRALSFAISIVNSNRENRKYTSEPNEATTSSAQSMWLAWNGWCSNLWNVNSF